MNEDVLSSGERSIAVGHQVVRSILATGDHNQFFIGDYELLRDAYIKPWQIYGRVQLDRFCGREWLLAELDTFLRFESHGYFVLESHAGLGKTTFMAWLAKQRGYLHHFVESAPGSDGVVPALRSLAAQLALEWKLNPYLVEGALPGAASRPDFFYDLLVNAAQKRDHEAPGEKIVILVDGLDEAGVPYGQNALGLPRVLPDGVYFVVSQRRVHVPLQVDGPRRVIQLEAEGADNLSDMRAYLQSAATWPGVALTLQGVTRGSPGPYTTGEFVEALLRKSQGVWIYLHYVIGEIERGERFPLDLENLPKNVWQYYAQYWQRWRAGDRGTWYEVFLPLLATLGTAQDSLSLPQLCALASVAEQPRLVSLLREDWAPFLSTDETNIRYRLYHASLREFLDGRVDLSRLESAERELASELARATKQAHARIVNRYISAWGGLDNGLPLLENPIRRDLDAGYGIRHLGAHIEGLSRTGWLHKLLSVSSVAHGNAWCEAKETAGDITGYSDDVMRAWRLAKAAYDPEDIATTGRNIGLECRCALIIASLRNVSENTPPGLLGILIEYAVFTPLQALAYAHQLRNPTQRTVALAAIIDRLPQSNLGEALSLARDVSDLKLRAELLARISAHLQDSRKDEVGSEALTMALQAIDTEHLDPIAKIELLTRLISHLPDAQRKSAIHKAMKASRMITDRTQWIHARIELCTYESDRGSVAKRLLLLCQTLPEVDTSDNLLRFEALIGLMPFLPEPERSKAVQQARIAANSGDTLARTSALVRLIPYASSSFKKKVTREALKTIRQVWYTTRTLEVAVALAPYLSGPQMTSVMRWVIDAAFQQGKVEKIADVSRALQEIAAEATTALLSGLPEAERKSTLQELLAKARAISDAGDQARLFVDLIPFMDHSEQKQALAKVQQRASALDSASDRVDILARIASQMAEEGRSNEALALSATIEDESTRVLTLKAVIPLLPKRSDLVSAMPLSYDRTGSIIGFVLRRAPRLPLKLRSLFWRSLVGNIWDENTMELRVGLARRLAELGSHHDALAIVMTTTGKPRADSVAAIVPFVPKPLLTTVLATIQTGQDVNEEGGMLANLLPLLQGQHQRQALHRALTAANSLLDGDSQYRAYAKLVPYVAQIDNLEEALDLMRSIPWNKGRVEALVGLLGALSDRIRVEIASSELPLIRQNADPFYRALAPAYVAPHLAESVRGTMLQETVAALQKPLGQSHPDMLWRQTLLDTSGSWMTLWSDNWYLAWAQAVATLMPYLKPTHQTELLNAIAVLDDADRTMALVQIAPVLPDSLLGRVIQMAATIDPGLGQTQALAALAPRVTQLPVAAIKRYWHATLPDLANHGRPALLAALQTMIPVIKALGGPAAISELYEAVADVGVWWK